MQKPAFDPGLTRQFGAPLRRAVNKDGTFNVRRRGVTWRAYHLWLHVVGMSWPKFAGVVAGFYLGVNTVFALIYFALEPDAVTGSLTSNASSRFMNDFFFSGHTLTTVGYGTLAPHGLGANITAMIEALVGLLGFAVITGLLVARASRPSARIGYSAHAVIAPYQDGNALMFRIANERSNNLMEMEARVMLMLVIKSTGTPERTFTLLQLERDSILMFPLTWTIVHPIDASSPLYGKTAGDLELLQAEILIVIKGFDDTFSQTVQSRYSYRFDEILWGAKFRPAFEVDSNGDLVLDVRKLDESEPAPVREISVQDASADCTRHAV